MKKQHILQRKSTGFHTFFLINLPSTCALATCAAFKQALTKGTTILSSRVIQKYGVCLLANELKKNSTPFMILPSKSKVSLTVLANFIMFHSKKACAPLERNLGSAPPER